MNKLLPKAFVVLILYCLWINPKLLFAQSIPSNALPQNLNCVQGSCNGFTVTTNGNTMNVTITGSAVAEATSGDVGSQAVANYYLNGNLLERIISGDPTTIAGEVNVTGGSLFLVNTNGIIFTGTAQVNAPGLIASTLDINNSDFLAGKYNFYQNGNPSYVINQGAINITNGGYIALLSNAVSNSGSITAQLGTVVLATGEAMTVALDSSNDFSVAVNLPDSQAVIGSDGNKMADAISNTGKIQADGGQIILNAQVLNNIFDNAVNNSDGVIQANNLNNNNGSIDLTFDNGNTQTGTVISGNDTISGISTSDGSITYSYGTLQINGGSLINSSYGTGSIYNDGGNLTLGGLIGVQGTTITSSTYSTGTITSNDGGGIITLIGGNTYIGPTQTSGTITLTSSGTITLNNSPIGGGSVTISSGSTYLGPTQTTGSSTFTGGTITLYNPPNPGSGTITTGTLTLYNPPSPGTGTITGGTLTLYNPPSPGTGTITGSGTITLNNPPTIITGGTITINNPPIIGGNVTLGSVITTTSKDVTINQGNTSNQNSTSVLSAITANTASKAISTVNSIGVSNL